MKTPNAKEFVELLKETYTEWNNDKAPRLGAALAFYTILSMAPLLVVIMGIIGVFYSGGEQALQSQIAGMVGKEAAGTISDILQNAHKNQAGGVMATVLGTATLLFSAGGLFGQLQDALDTIWEVKPKPAGFLEMVKNRFLSFSMVLGVGFFLLVSLVLSALLASGADWLESILPVPTFVLQAVNVVVTFVLFTGMFAMIFKVLPDAEIAWRDVWIGAAMTSLLFGIGKLALGLYLGRSTVGSAYGAAGSLVVLLLWIYYAAQILFFGAEFTQVYARKYGSKIIPSPNAEPLTPEAKAEQGIPDKSASEKNALVPAASAVTVVRPFGVSPKTSQQRDLEFLWPAAVGFLSVLLFKQRRKKSS